jgi:hypothetical protein
VWTCQRVKSHFWQRHSSSFKITDRNLPQKQQPDWQCIRNCATVLSLASVHAAEQFFWEEENNYRRVDSVERRGFGGAVFPVEQAEEGVHFWGISGHFYRFIRATGRVQRGDKEVHWVWELFKDRTVDIYSRAETEAERVPGRQPITDRNNYWRVLPEVIAAWRKRHIAFRLGNDVDAVDKEAKLENPENVEHPLVTQSFYCVQLRKVVLLPNIEFRERQRDFPIVIGKVLQWGNEGNLDHDWLGCSHPWLL